MPIKSKSGFREETLYVFSAKKRHRRKTIRNPFSAGGAEDSDEKSSSAKKGGHISFLRK